MSENDKTWPIILACLTLLSPHAIAKELTVEYESDQLEVKCLVTTDDTKATEKIEWITGAYFMLTSAVLDEKETQRRRGAFETATLGVRMSEGGVRAMLGDRGQPGLVIRSYSSERLIHVLHAYRFKSDVVDATYVVKKSYDSEQDVRELLRRIFELVGALLEIEDAGTRRSAFDIVQRGAAASLFATTKVLAEGKRNP